MLGIVYLYDVNLNGNVYLNNLQNCVSYALNGMPPQKSIDAWYQQDGAHPHNTRGVIVF